jgi:hypothetical protein
MGRLTTTCMRGHPWTPESTYTFPNGGRTCRICRTVRFEQKYRTLAESPPTIPGHAHCSYCDTTKPIDGFRLDRRRKSGVSPWCTECWAAHNRFRNHGLGAETYRAMVEDNNDRCVICSEPESIRENLSVDHDHVTGMIRGLLCHSCNVGLGHFRDNPELLRAAADYMERYLGLYAAIAEGAPA